MSMPLGAMRLRGRGLVLLFAALLPIFGCGRAKGTVAGTVSFQNKPLPGGFITFVPEQAGGSYSGKIEPDGTYRVAGIPAGPVKIGVRANEPTKYAEGMIPPSEMAKIGKKGMKAPAKAPTNYVKIPPSYNDPEQSGLRLTVTGGSQEHNVTLK